MRPRTLALVFCTATLVAALPARAQPAGDDAAGFDDDAGGDPAAVADAAQKKALEDAPRYGVGLRLRNIWAAQGLIELFMEEAASGVSSVGFGADFIRRRGDFEFSIGLEYESLSPDDGFYVEHGGAPTMPGTTDYIEFNGFSWLTLDAAFVFHKSFNDVFALRYGGGFGLGLLFGEILETDAVCTGSNAQTDCIKDENGAQVNEEQDYPPVFPVVNILGGVQIRPADQLVINIELGVRTVPYIGVGTQYLF